MRPIAYPTMVIPEAFQPLPLEILVIEDDDVDFECLRRTLKKSRLLVNLSRAQTKAEFDLAIQQKNWDIAVSDYNLPDLTFSYIATTLQETKLDIPIILVSGVLSENAASEMLQAGIKDFINKDNLARLCPVVKREVEYRHSRLARREAQFAVLEQSARWDAVSDALSDGIILIDADGMVEFCSKAIEAIAGYSSSELTGASLRNNVLREAGVVPIQFGLPFIPLDTLLADSPRRLEALLFHRNQHWVPAEVSIQLYGLDGTTKYCLLIRDIKQQIKERWLEQMRIEFNELNARLKCQINQSHSLEDLCKHILLEISKVVTVNLGEQLCLHVHCDKGHSKRFSLILNEFVAADISDSNRTAPLPDDWSELESDRALEVSFRLSMKGQADQEALGFLKLTLNNNTELRSHLVDLLRVLATTIAEMIEAYQSRVELLKLQKVVEDCPVTIVVTNPQGIIEYINESGTQRIGFSKAELVGQHTRIFRSGLTPNAVYKNLWNTIKAGKHWTGELLNCTKDGPLIWENMTVYPIKNRLGDITHFVSVKQDITEQKLQEKHLNYLTTHDNVTGLANQTLLRDRLQQAIQQTVAEDTSGALIILNIVNFSQYNEFFGFAESNRLLKEIGRMLQSRLGAADTIARCDSAEFQVILRNIASESALEKRFYELISVFECGYRFGEIDITLQFYAGAALYPHQGVDVDELTLLAEASKAVAKTKKTGNQLTIAGINTQPRTVAPASLSLSADIHKALEGDQFELYFQPQVNLRLGRISSCEALIRWNHPTKGLVSPAYFIPYAEENGLIVTIGNWVINEAFTRIKQWQSTGKTQIVTAVNLCSQQLAEADFILNIERLIDKYQINTRLIQFELTESSLLHNVQGAIRTMQQLRELGFTLAIDDFGTGYSNLGYLKQLPIDKLKIDRCFIKEMTHNAEDKLLSKMIVQIGHALGLSVVAEGVETEAQLQLLRRMGCDLIQGFYFSKPLPESQFLPLLDKEDWVSTTEEDKETLLILDDEKPILSALNRLLRKEKYRVITTSSAREALDTLALHKIGVIISDQRMPEMSGSEFFRRVKKMYPSTIRIMLSGYSEVESLTCAVNEGSISKFLVKPWDDEQLKAEIQAAFQRYRDKIGTVAVTGKS